jgi:hypothetical protein
MPAAASKLHIDLAKSTKPRHQAALPRYLELEFELWLTNTAAPAPVVFAAH